MAEEPITISDPDSNLERLRLALERYKSLLNFRSTIISVIFASGVAIAIPAAVQALNKYLDIRLSDQSADRENVAKWVENFTNQRIELRIRLAEYFSAISEGSEKAGFQQLLRSLESRRTDVQAKIVERQRKLRAINDAESIEYFILHEEIVWLSEQIDFVPVSLSKTDSGQSTKDDNPSTSVTPANNTILLSLLGNPRSGYSNDCQAVEAEPLKSLILPGENVGPFKVTMVVPAVQSLRELFAEVETERPDIVARLSTAGALCVRFIRGSRTTLSNHSWGTAVDIMVDGRLPPIGAKLKGENAHAEAYRYLAQKFEARGWYWGDNSSRSQEPYHFEVGEALLRQWARDGKLGRNALTTQLELDKNSGAL